MLPDLKIDSKPGKLSSQGSKTKTRPETSSASKSKPVSKEKVPETILEQEDEDSLMDIDLNDLEDVIISQT